MQEHARAKGAFPAEANVFAAFPVWEKYVVVKDGCVSVLVYYIFFFCYYHSGGLLAIMLIDFEARTILYAA